jgi:Leucine-rich repeat (LRR) protein
MRLAGCDSLEYLDLEWTTVTDFHLEKLLKDIVASASLHTLVSIKLHHCKNISNIVFPTLPALTHLDVSSTGIVRDSVSNALVALPNLKYLRLSYCQSLKQVFITNHPNIIEVYLDHCSRSLYNVESHGCDKLRLLDLSYTATRSEVVALLLRNNPFIETLSVNYCNKLQSLDLRKNKEHDDSELMNLELKKCFCSFTDVRDDFVNELCEACPKLDTLELRQTLIVRPTIRLQHLTKLNLAATEINSETLTLIVAGCPELVDLSVGYAIQVMELNLPYHENLQYLVISRLLFPNGEVERMLQSLPNLEFLDVGVNKVLTELVIADHSKLKVLVMNLCDHIKRLEIRGTPSLKEIQMASTVHLEEIELDCPSVQMINCDGTSTKATMYLKGTYEPLGVTIVNHKTHGMKRLPSVDTENVIFNN